MKRVRHIIGALLLLPMLLPLPILSAPLTEDETGAKTVLLRYFDALAQGDTASLRSMMEGGLLEKRFRLLDNPSYSTNLIETYRNARFSIDNIEAIGPSNVAIDASIIFDQDNISLRRFLLRKIPSPSDTNATFHIYSETEPTIR